jgi:hypothetical protein
MTMVDQVEILTTALNAGYGLIVTFSDGTIAYYVVEELLDLRPYRDTTEAATEATSESNARKK